MKVYSQLLDVTVGGIQSFMEDRTHKKIVLYTTWIDYKHNTHRSVLAESEPFLPDQNWKVEFQNHTWEYIAVRERVYLVGTTIDI